MSDYLINWSLGGHAPPPEKFNKNPFITYGDILLTRNYEYRHTDTHAAD